MTPGWIAPSGAIHAVSPQFWFGAAAVIFRGVVDSEARDRECGARQKQAPPAQADRIRVRRRLRLYCISLSKAVLVIASSLEAPATDEPN